MVIAESAVVRALTPAEKVDSDAWPRFILKSVKVYEPETKKRVSLLAVHEAYTVTVEGILGEVDGTQARRLKSKKYCNKPVQLSDVATYAFSDDAPLRIWAAGSRGWYELLTPARDYASHFEDMKEAVAMIYHLGEQYRNAVGNVPRSIKGQEKYVRGIFADFLATDYCTRVDEEDAIDGFHHHRDFLVKTMLDGHDGLDWAPSSILKYFKRHFPKDYALAATCVEGPKVEEASHTEDESKPDGTATTPMIDSLSEDAGLSDKRGRVTRTSTAGKRRSTLRPKGNQSSKKYMTRRNSGMRPDDEKAEDEDDKSSEDNAKAKDEVAAVLKRDKSYSVDDILAINAANTADLPGYYHANLPDDMWICPYDGCIRQVWNASTEESIDAIKTHFATTHAEQAEELISSEMRPWVSVEHLLERVKGIASLQAQLGTEGFPKPIVRRF